MDLEKINEVVSFLDDVLRGNPCPEPSSYHIKETKKILANLTEEKTKITIYTSSHHSPAFGISAWGAVVSFGDMNSVIKMKGAEKYSSKRAVELKSIVRSVNRLFNYKDNFDNYKIEIITDSEYILDRHKELMHIHLHDDHNIPCVEKGMWEKLTTLLKDEGVEYNFSKRGFEGERLEDTLAQEALVGLSYNYSGEVYESCYA